MSNKYHNVVIKVTTQAEKIGALHFLAALAGKPVSPLVLENTMKGENIKDYPYVYVDGSCAGATSIMPDNKTQYCFADMGKITAQKEFEVVLNDNHTAIVTKDTIKVGCQAFPISVLDALNKAYEKVKN